MTANRNRFRPINRPVFHHTTFATLKLDEMVEFYEKVAGLESVFHGDSGAWLTNDAANHRIALLALPGLIAPEDKGHATGLHHTAFEYDDFDAWVDNYERLATEGIEPFMSLDHGMTMSMYYQDPEGNGVEIQVDNFGDWSRSKEYMWASQDFSDNPIGEFFDPEKVAAERADGLDHEEIHRRAMAGSYRPEVVPDVHLPELW
ncbi:VOC family protein [Paramicrobacterium chengjingii]|uniref:VOC family protein n=1 Tax=Paramicrobacterium chengjingii TaxID=2769067 RepID=UPI00141EB922|nr:VOC family protein [Microbacterium chengjingii]